jgi:hypothetical protein
MRREGYEFQLGQPQVIMKEIDGERCEPVEMLTVQVPEAFSSKVIDLVSRRKGELLSVELKGDRVHIEFNIPARGIIGLRNPLLTATEGEAIIAHRFKGYEPWKGELGVRRAASIISQGTGTAIAFSINKLQDRGKFFVDPGDEVYMGQVIGENPKTDDLVVNVLKGKQLTNMRASGTDNKENIAPAVKFSLEECMEYISDDEYLEVTPKSLRMRKIPGRERRKKAQQEAGDGGVLVGLLTLGSCAPVKQIETAKTLNIYGPGVIHHPVIADLDVSNNKVNGSASGLSTNLSSVKSEAISDAVKTAGADLLVEPVFVIQPVGSRVNVTVTGFPASYKNFRAATQADLPLLEAGVMQRAKTTETVPEPVKKRGAAGAVVVLVLAIGTLAILGVAGGL